MESLVCISKENLKIPPQAFDSLRCRLEKWPSDDGIQRVQRVTHQRLADQSERCGHALDHGHGTLTEPEIA